jgi:RNA polymerase sigma-70 factor (ECF subfamily)
MSDDVKAFEPGGVPSRTDRGPKPPSEVTVRLFEEAVRNHSRRLLAIARAVVGTRASPEDVVQQAITNLFQHRERYDWHEPGGLLKRAVVNEALRILRQPKMSMVADDHPGRGDDDPSSGMLENETVRRVRDAIDKLPDHYRSALVLCEYDNMPYAEIATTLGASVPQVKTWIFRARRQLAEMLKDYANA